MKLSVLIPAHNEEACIEQTIRALESKLVLEGINHEILVINDNSTDLTWKILADLRGDIPNLRCENNFPPHGYGLAVRKGLELYQGDAVAIVMADASDRPEDLIAFYRELVDKKVDCVFGSRFVRGSDIHGYPKIKLILNRFANLLIRIFFGIRYNDTTNAFKLYRRHAIDGLRPFLSHHFNLTVELPLKAIVRGYSYSVLPNSWINKRKNESTFKIKEMGSRYLFIILYCFIEKWLSKRDYMRQ